MLTTPLFGRWHLSTVKHPGWYCYVLFLPSKCLAWALRPHSWWYRWYGDIDGRLN